MSKLASLTIIAATLAIGTGLARAELADGFDAALAADARPAEDKARDAARRPKAVLEFGAISAGMTVLDVAASSGWYTEVLSAAVGPEGRVVAHNTERARERAGDALQARADRLGNVSLLFADFGDMGLDAEVDAALTALNLHDHLNRSSEAGRDFIGDVFRALKPGGVFIVIDHEGNADLDNRALHRLPVGAAIRALEEAGFVVEEISDALDNPDDDHSLNIRDESLQRNTDRFLIRARKPG